MLLSVLFFSGTAFAQQAPPQQQAGPGPSQQPDWPRTFTTDDGTVVKIYQPAPESFSDNVMKSRWAISVLQQGKSDPVFGTFWSVSNVETDKDSRRVIIQSAKVPNVRFPGQPDENFIFDNKNRGPLHREAGFCRNHRRPHLGTPAARRDASGVREGVARSS